MDVSGGGRGARAPRSPRGGRTARHASPRVASSDLDASSAASQRGDGGAPDVATTAAHPPRQLYVPEPHTPSPPSNFGPQDDHAAHRHSGGRLFVRGARGGRGRRDADVPTRERDRDRVSLAGHQMDVRSVEAHAQPEESEKGRPERGGYRRTPANGGEGRPPVRDRHGNRVYVFGDKTDPTLARLNAILAALFDGPQPLKAVEELSAFFLDRGSSELIDAKVERILGAVGSNVTDANGMSPAVAEAVGRVLGSAGAARGVRVSGPVALWAARLLSSFGGGRDAGVLCALASIACTLDPQRVDTRTRLAVPYDSAQGSVSHAVERYDALPQSVVAATASAVAGFIDGTPSPVLFRASLPVVCLLAERHAAQFLPIFRDVVDVLIGWLADPTTAAELAADIQSAMGALRQYFGSNTLLGLSLLADIVDDMDAVLAETTRAAQLGDGDVTSRQESPPASLQEAQNGATERRTRKGAGAGRAQERFSAFCRCFCAVAEGLGDHLHAAVAGAASQAPGGQLVSRLIANASLAVSKYASWDVCRAANAAICACAVHLRHHFASHATAAGEVFLAEPLVCGVAGPAVGDSVCAWAHAVRKTALSSGAVLPVSFARELLRKGSPLLVIGIGDDARAAEAAASVLSSLVASRSVACAEYAQRFVADLLADAISVLKSASHVEVPPDSAAMQARTAVMCASALGGTSSLDLKGASPSGGAAMALLSASGPSHLSILRRQVDFDVFCAFPAVAVAVVDAMRQLAMARLTRRDEVSEPRAQGRAITIAPPPGAAAASAGNGTTADDSPASLWPLVLQLSLCARLSPLVRRVALTWAAEMLETLTEYGGRDGVTHAHVGQLMSCAVELSSDAEASVRAAAGALLSSVRALLVHRGFVQVRGGRQVVNLAPIASCAVPRISDVSPDVAAVYKALYSSLLPGSLGAAHARIGTALAFTAMASTAQLPSSELPAGLLEACLAAALNTSPQSDDSAGGPFASVVSGLVVRCGHDSLVGGALSKCLTSRLAAAQVALAECARVSVFSRLRQPYGDPLALFGALDRVFREYSALAAKAAEDDPGPASTPPLATGPHGTVPSGSVRSRRERAVLLLSFVGGIERHAFAAAEGCVSVPRAPAGVSQFYRLNRRLWVEWLSRGRLQIASTALAAGASASAVLHGFERLAELLEAVRFGPPRERQRQRTEFERCALLVVSALVRLREADAIAGLAAWGKSLLSPELPPAPAAAVSQGPSGDQGRRTVEDSMPTVPLQPAAPADPKWLAWIDGALLEAQGKYEAAVAAYATALTALQAPESSSMQVESDPLVAQHVIDRTADCYARLTDWDGLRRWQASLASPLSPAGSQSSQSPHRSAHAAGAAGNPQRHLRVRRDAHALRAIENFDSWDDAGARAAFEMARGELSADALCDVGALLVVQQRYLVQAMALAAQHGPAVDQNAVRRAVAAALGNARAASSAGLSASVAESIQETIPFAVGLKLAECVETVAGGDPSAAFRVLSSDVFGPDGAPLDPSVHEAGMWADVLRVARFAASEQARAGRGSRLSTLMLVVPAAKLARKQGNLHLARKLLEGDSARGPVVDYERSKLLYARGRSAEAAVLMASVAQHAHHDVHDGALVAARAFRALSKWLQGARRREELLAAVVPVVAPLAMPRMRAGLEASGALAAGTTEDAADWAVGACSQLATARDAAEYPKVWAEFAGWCYRRGRMLVERSEDPRPAPPPEGQPPQGHVSTGGVEVRPEDERDLRIAIVGAVGEGPAADEMVARIVRLVSQAPPPTPKGLPPSPATGSGDPARVGAMVDVVAPILSQCGAAAASEKVAEVWARARDRAMELFVLAANGYLTYLRSGAGAAAHARDDDSKAAADVDDKDALAEAARTGASGAAHRVMASLRLLRLLVRHGDELPDSFHEALSLAPSAAWDTIVPQMLARMGHADRRALVRIGALLSRVSQASPHLVAYPVVSQLIDVEEAAANGETERAPDGRSRGAGGIGREGLAPLADALCARDPALVPAMRGAISELRRIAVLWEEEWAEALYRTQSEAVPRLRRLDEDAKRVFDNPTLTEAEKCEVIGASHRAVMQPVVLALERVRAATYGRVTTAVRTPHEARFVEAFGGDLDAAIAQLRSPVDFRVPSGVWAPFRKILRILAEFSQRWCAIEIGDVSPVLASMRDTPLPLPGDVTGLARVRSFGGNVAVLRTKTHPKKLWLSASDGSTHAFLLKGTEDLHLDERIMQFLAVINTMLACDSSANARKYEGGRYALMRARTYAVVPLAAKCGLIRWVDGATPLFNLYKAWYVRDAAAKKRDGVRGTSTPPAHSVEPPRGESSDDGSGSRRGRGPAAGASAASRGRGRGIHPRSPRSAAAGSMEPLPQLAPKPIQLQLARAPAAHEATENGSEQASKADEEAKEPANDADDDAQTPMPRPADIYFARMGPALREKGVVAVGDRESWPRGVARRVHEELVSETPADLIARELFCASGSAAHWWEATKSIARTTAVMSVVGYVIGLGDRHLDNILVDLRRAEIVHIDYNVCFERGLRLRVPERVPFRLTQNIERAFGHTGCEGVFRLSCERAMATLRRGREALLTLLDAFVYDPQVDWSAGRALETERREMELSIATSLLAARLTEVRASMAESLRGARASLEGLAAALPAAAVGRQQEVLLTQAAADAEREVAELLSALRDVVPRGAGELRAARADVEVNKVAVSSALGAATEAVAKLAARGPGAEARVIADAAAKAVVSTLLAAVERHPPTLPLEADIARVSTSLRAFGHVQVASELERSISDGDAHAAHRRACLVRCLKWLQAYMHFAAPVPPRDIVSGSRMHALAGALSELVACAAIALDSAGAWHAVTTERVQRAAKAAQSAAEEVDIFESDRRASALEARLCALVRGARGRLSSLAEAQRALELTAPSTNGISTVKDALDAVRASESPAAAVYLGAALEIASLRGRVVREEVSLPVGQPSSEPESARPVLDCIPSAGLLAAGKAALSVLDVCLVGVDGVAGVLVREHAFIRAATRVCEAVYEAALRYDSILLPELLNAVRSRDPAVAESLSALRALALEAEGARSSSVCTRSLRVGYASLIRTGVKHADGASSGRVSGGRVLLAAFDGLFATLDKSVRELRDAVSSLKANSPQSEAWEPFSALSEADDDRFFLLKLRCIAACIASAQELVSLSGSGPFSPVADGASESASPLESRPVAQYAREVLAVRLFGALSGALSRAVSALVHAAMTTKVSAEECALARVEADALASLLPAESGEPNATSFISIAAPSAGADAGAVETCRKLLSSLSESVGAVYIGECHTAAVRGAAAAAALAENAAAAFIFTNLPVLSRWADVGPLAQLLRLPAPKAILEGLQTAVAATVQAEASMRAIDERQRLVEEEAARTLTWVAADGGESAQVFMQSLSARRARVAADAERIGTAGWLCDAVLAFEASRASELSLAASSVTDAAALAAAKELAGALSTYSTARARLSAAEADLGPVARLVGHDVSATQLGVVGAVPIEIDIGQLVEARVSELSDAAADTGAALAAVRKELSESLYPPLVLHASALAKYAVAMDSLVATEIRPLVQSIANVADRIEGASARTVREQASRLADDIQRIPSELNSTARLVFVEAMGAGVDEGAACVSVGTPKVDVDERAALSLRLSPVATDEYHSRLLPAMHGLDGELAGLTERLSALAAVRLEGSGGADPEDIVRQRKGERSAVAMGAWKRVKAKLEGRDFDPNRKLTVQQQVDMTIRESRNPDNLAAMYEGWMAWV